MDKLTDNSQEIKKLSEAFGSFIKELEVLKDKKEVFGKSKSAKTEDPEPDKDDMDKKMNDMHNNFYQSLHAVASSLHDRLDRISNNHYDYQSSHSKGHLPSLSPSQMTTALDKMGCGGDFQVHKPTVYAATASVNKNIKLVEIDFRKK